MLVLQLRGRTPLPPATLSCAGAKKNNTFPPTFQVLLPGIIIKFTKTDKQETLNSQKHENSKDSDVKAGVYAIVGGKRGEGRGPGFRNESELLARD